MDNELNQSVTTSLNQFIPQSPAKNTHHKEVSRWQYRENKNANQMTLLANIESYVEHQQSPPSQSQSSNTHKHNAPSKPNPNTKPFLRRGQGTVNKRNKYRIEQQKRAERKRIRQLGIDQSKPKTQKDILMEQWRAKLKQKDKIARKNKEKNSVQQITVFKHKNKPKQTHTNPVSEEQKAPSLPNDELQSNSQFEELSTFDDGILDKQHLNEQKCESETAIQSHNTEIGIWTKPTLPKKFSLTHKPQKTYNFARQPINDRKRLNSYPKYTHHHHTALYGSKRNSIPTSKSNKIKVKYATINTVSKRDRLAAKSNDRKSEKTQRILNAEKSYIEKTNEMKEIIAKYEEKCADSERMKQSSLESFRKYTHLCNEKESDLVQRQKDFEKYKRKQERIMCQKSTEMDKRARALLNIPDRKQRNAIAELKKEINDLKLGFIEKEKRYKSKLERLKKQCKKVKFEKIELQNEMKKYEKERLERMQKIENIQRNTHMPRKKQKKKKYSISRVNVNANRPKTMQTHRKRVTTQTQPTQMRSDTMVNRSTNNLYQRFENNGQNNVNCQSMNNVQLLHYNNMNEYELSSSESSSSSDHSTANGEVTSEKLSNRVVSNIAIHGNGNGNTEEKQKEEMHGLPPILPEFDPDKMSTEQINSESVANIDNPMERMQHPDGKIEQVYSDGSKVILFPNQTEKYIFGNLQKNGSAVKQVYVKFPNGDVKKILSDGTEVYYYSNNNIIHATKLDGIQLFFFNSQHEVHFPDNTKHILFADGTKKYIYPNGDEQCVYKNNKDSNDSIQS